jgi:hypothetical protein
MTVEANPPTIQADTASHSPVPASEPGREPLNDVQAYIVGMDAARAGKDLSHVIYVGFSTFPGTATEVCDATASAVVDWWAHHERRAVP